MQSTSPTTRCVIVDDEEMATKVLEAHLKHIPDFEIVGIYHSAVEAFLALDKIEADVLFLDIQMPNITGLEMVKMLKNEPLVVLTTAHREYALEGFELAVVDYLLKPIGLNRFLQTISRLKQRLQQTEEVAATVLEQPAQRESSPSATYIFIKTNRAYQKINFADILHIESVKNHVKIITPDATHVSLIAISELEQQLPQHFLRVHRSFIVNSTNVVRFDNYTVEHAQGTVPIGRTYKAITLEQLRMLL